MFPEEILAQLREHQRRRELNALALVELRRATIIYWGILGANDRPADAAPSRCATCRRAPIANPARLAIVPCAQAVAREHFSPWGRTGAIR